MNETTKIINPGSIQTHGGRWGRIYIKITMGNHNNDFTLTGVVGPLPSGGAIGNSCGQIDMEFDHRLERHNSKHFQELISPDDINFHDGWDKETWFDLLEIWHYWHQKDMKIVPGKVLERIESFPETTRQPAWV